MPSQPNILTLDENRLAIEVSIRLKDLRKYAKLNQQAAADRFGIAKSTWQRLEAGNLPTGGLLAALARDGYSIHWLLTGDGEMRIGEKSGVKMVALDTATAAAIALAETYSSSPRKIGDDALSLLFEDFCRGFEDAASGSD